MRTHSRRFWLTAVLIVAIGIAALAINPIGSSAESKPSKWPPSCHNNPVTAPEFRPFSEAVWNRDHWKRAEVSKSILDAKAHKLHCAAGPGHVASMKKEWSKDQSAFDHVRKGKLWVLKHKPYIYPDGKRWAAPYPIAWCESGGDYFVGPSGAYGLIPPFEQYLAPKVQDEIAYQLMQEGKEYSAWVEWEGDCQYR
jgi:hypothetical protein